MKLFNFKNLTPLRISGILLIAIAILNITNYIFCWLYTPFWKGNYNKKQSAFTVVMFRGSLVCDTSPETSKPSNTFKSTTTITSIEDSEATMTFKGMFTYYAVKVTKLPLCPEFPPGIGPVLSDPSMDAIQSFDRMYSNVKIGGIYKPSNCTARQRVAIIIPYRSCKRGTNIKHLGTFLYMLHPFLMKQQLDYQVFVIEQANLSQAYNHGKLLNAGFTEVQRRGNHETRFPCIIIHEPYILPMDTRNLYRCERYPKQLAISVERPHKKPYIPKFGGAIAISSEQFLRINGFSNTYWGNDGDYEDIYNRLINANYTINRSDPKYGKYTTIKNFELPVVKRSSLARTASPLHLIDGLTTLSYTVNSFSMKYVFTYINVSIDDDDAMKFPTKTERLEKNLKQYE